MFHVQERQLSLSSLFFLKNVHYAVRVFYCSYFYRKKKNIYSQTSMARTSLGPWKFVRDMGSSSH